MIRGEVTLEIRRRHGPAIDPETSLLPNGGSPGPRDSFHVTFDPGGESVVEVIVNAVGLVHDVDQTELEPLATAVDPDSLDRLFATDSAVREVSFVYEDLEITVGSEGDVWLERR